MILLCRFLCLFLTALLFASCVVHDKFPFICFRGGCVSQGYNIRGFKKRVKGQLALNARKRDAARNRKDDEKNGGSSSKDQSAEDVADPELSYASKVIYTKYFLKFFIANDSAQLTDSIIIFHTSEYHDITEADQPRLEHFIKKLPAKKVNRVEVREVDTGELREEQHVIISRQNKIRRFLRRQHVKGTITIQFK